MKHPLLTAARADQIVEKALKNTPQKQLTDILDQIKTDARAGFRCLYKRINSKTINELLNLGYDVRHIGPDGDTRISW